MPLSAMPWLFISTCFFRKVSSYAAAKTHPFICERSFITKKLEIEETKTT
jgi:hypothetical protein